MAADGNDGVKAHEPGAATRLAQPEDTAAPGRVREALRLGERTYPVWTPAMVEARDRLRKAGRKWYLLYDKLYDQRNLSEAWKQVESNRGAPGLSGETIKQYGETIDERLDRLRERLKERRYEPRPIRRAYIPKTDGSGRMRELGIPEVEDRVVQAAVVRLIEPIFEAKFLGCSFGFRPGRSAHHALARVEQAIGGERPWVVDADIRNCFGSIPHEPLMEQVAAEVSDGKLLDLVRGFVKADIVEELSRWTPQEGTPQGAVLSPLLANIYLHEFDRRMAEAGCEVVRYADDFVVLCRSEEQAQAARDKAEEVLAQMGLTMHPEKTRVIDARTMRFQFLGYEFWPGGREPRPPSMDKLKDRIRAKTPHSSGQSLRETVRELNPFLRGWYGYFKHSFWNVLKDVDGLVRRRLRSILRKFDGRKGTSKGTGADQTRWPNAYFDTLGLFSMSRQHERDARGPRRLIPFPAKA
jgi:RNA-directed DNA polymerase